MICGLFLLLDTLHRYIHAKFQGPQSQFRFMVNFPKKNMAKMAGIEPFTSRSEKLAGPILNLMVSTPTISGSDYNISKFQLKQNARTLCSPCFHTYGIDI